MANDTPQPPGSACSLPHSSTSTYVRWNTNGYHNDTRAELNPLMINLFCGTSTLMLVRGQFATGGVFENTDALFAL